MKKTCKVLILCFILLLTFSSVCFAENVTSVEDGMVTALLDSAQTTENQDITVPNTDGDIYEGGNSVLINGNINGNSFIFGSEVKITGRIDGDLFVLANSLVIEENAIIEGNIFAVAQQITFKGIASDAYIIAKSFTLEKSANIIRDLKISSASSSFNGKIGRDLYVSGPFSFATDAEDVVARDFYYSAQKEVEIPEGIIAGKINFSEVKISEPSTTDIIKKYITSFITVILYAVVTILLATFITPGFAEKATYTTSKKSFIAILIGVLAFVLTPFISIFLLITGILSYVSFALITVYLLILSITISILGITIGNNFANKLKNKTRAKTILLSIASVAVLWLAQQIPYVGNYISIFTVVYGLGIFIYSLFVKKETIEKVEEK